MLSLEPVSVPIVDGGRISGSLDVRMVVLPADGNPDALNSAMPQLRAAARTALADFASLYASPWQAVDASQLAASLTTEAKRAVPGVSQILLIEIRARPA